MKKSTWPGSVNVNTNSSYSTHLKSPKMKLSDKLILFPWKTWKVNLYLNRIVSVLNSEIILDITSKSRGFFFLKVDFKSNQLYWLDLLQVCMYENVQT